VPCTLDAYAARAVEKGLDLAVLGWRRWRLAASTLFLAQACRQAAELTSSGEPLRHGIVNTLAAFLGRALWLPHPHSSSLDSLLRRIVVNSQPSGGSAPAEHHMALAAQALEREGMAAPNGGDQAASLTGAQVPPTVAALLLYLLGPDPLDALCRRIAGLAYESGI
jgi:hypothetical protein